MRPPFEVLGLRAWATQDEIRAAYRVKVKQIHPDRFQDPSEKQAAMEKMVELNLAYEEALRVAAPRQNASYRSQLPRSEAVILAEKMLKQGNPESALRQLNRTAEKDAAWYNASGQAFMMLRRYEEAHRSYRIAVKMEPDNNIYRAGALDAALAMKREATFQGRIQKWFRNIKRGDSHS